MKHQVKLQFTVIASYELNTNYYPAGLTIDEMVAQDIERVKKGSELFLGVDPEMQLEIRHLKD